MSAPFSARRRVALTGATGFIGRAICRTLGASGWRVRVLVRDPEAELPDPAVERVPGSLHDRTSLARLVDGVDAVIHCAGLTRARVAADYHRVNVVGTASLIEAAQAGRTPPRFLLVSSLAAREPSLSSYAASKHAAESLLIQRYPPGHFCIVRPPAVYGPGDRATLSLFRLLRHRFAFLPGHAESRFSLIYIDDLVRAMAGLLDWPDWNGAIVEPDDGRPGGYRWTDLTAMASAHLGYPVRPVHVPKAVLWAPAGAYQAVARLFGAAPMLTIDKLRELFHRDWVCRLLPSGLVGVCRGATQFGDGFAVTLRWYVGNRWL